MKVFKNLLAVMGAAGIVALMLGAIGTIWESNAPGFWFKVALTGFVLITAGGGGLVILHDKPKDGR